MSALQPIVFAVLIAAAFAAVVGCGHLAGDGSATAHCCGCDLPGTWF